MNIFKRYLSSSQKSAKIQLKILDNPLSSIQSRPLAPYAVFVKENFALVGQQLSSKESPKIIAELGKRWKDLGDKDVYQKKAKDINENAMAQLDSTLKRLGVFDFKIIQRRRALEKVLGRSPPKFRDESRPKSLSPHAIYFGKNYAQFKNEESPMKAAHEAYGKLSKDEKQVIFT